MAIAFSPKKNLLASGNREGLVQFWDLSSGREVDRIKASGLFITTMAFSPDGNAILTANWVDVPRIWTIGTLPERAVWELKTSEYAAGVAFSPDGKTAATGGDKVICLWDATCGRQIQRLEGSPDLVRALAFSPDGKRLASAGQFDDSVHVWDLSTGKEILRRSSGSLEARSIAYSPDGRFLAWGEANWPCRVHLFDAVEERELLRMSGHRGTIQSLAFSPDGRRLASGGADGVIRLWDVGTGACLLTLDLGKAEVNGVAFLPNGATLASASSDGSVLLWKLPASK